MPHTLLTIPRTIREQIYRFSGIPVDAENLLLQPGARACCPWIDQNFPRIAPACSLLYTCRIISKEVSFLLYSTNTFYVRYGQPSDLQSVRNLSPATLRAIKSLRVCLSVSSCIKECTRSLPNDRRPSFAWDLPLECSSIEGKAILDDWHQTAQYIGEHIQPNHLDLAFLCDCADTLSATIAIGSLVSQLPTLASCSIRLSRHRNAELQELAEHAAYRAVGHEPPVKQAGPFRFEALPLEIRLLILEYTDLVTPMEEVAWVPDLGYHLLDRGCFCVDGLPQLLDVDALNGIDDWHDDRIGHYACNFRNCIRYSKRGCFCTRYHSAFTTWSPRCNCWMPPTPLFLVSHAVRRHAQMVFFSKNRFSVFGKHPPTGENPRYPASIFLADIVSGDCLRHLRFLEIVFPIFDEYDYDADPAYHEWRRCVESVKHSLSLPLLTVRVHMEEYYCGDDEITEFRQGMSSSQGIALRLAYLNMTNPLKKWGDCGLYRLFVYFPWPWDCTPQGIELLRRAREGLGTYPDRQETLIEQHVMGPDYNSKSMGKDTVKPSEWLISICLVYRDYLGVDYTGLGAVF